MPALDIQPIRYADARAWCERHLARPRMTPETPLAGDMHEALHLGAFQATTLVGVVSVTPPARAGSPAIDAWRVSELYVAPEARGRGIGRRLLEECLQYIAVHGGNTVSGYARSADVGFYCRFGFLAQGEEFEVTDEGPHIAISRPIALEDRRFADPVRD